MVHARQRRRAATRTAAIHYGAREGEEGEANRRRQHFEEEKRRGGDLFFLGLLGLLGQNPDRTESFSGRYFQSGPPLFFSGPGPIGPVHGGP